MNNRNEKSGDGKMSRIIPIVLGGMALIGLRLASKNADNIFRPLIRNVHHAIPTGSFDYAATAMGRQVARFYVRNAHSEEQLEEATRMYWERLDSMERPRALEWAHKDLAIALTQVRKNAVTGELDPIEQPILGPTMWLIQVAEEMSEGEDLFTTLSNLREQDSLNDRQWLHLQRQILATTVLRRAEKEEEEGGVQEGKAFLEQLAEITAPEDFQGECQDEGFLRKSYLMWYPMQDAMNERFCKLDFEKIFSSRDISEQ